MQTFYYLRNTAITVNINATNLMEMKTPPKKIPFARTETPAICRAPEFPLRQLTRTRLQRLGRFSLALAVMSLVPLVVPRLSVPAAFAADEICAACGQQVSVNGDFAHRKDNASVTIEGASNNAAAFHEEIDGTNFTVSIAHLPAGKYSIVIGEVETLVSAPGERLFDVASGDVALATNFDIFAAASGARKVCYITGAVEHEGDSIRGPLKVSFSASKTSHEVRVVAEPVLVAEAKASEVLAHDALDYLGRKPPVHRHGALPQGRRLRLMGSAEAPMAVAEPLSHARARAVSHGADVAEADAGALTAAARSGAGEAERVDVLASPRRGGCVRLAAGLRRG